MHRFIQELVDGIVSELQQQEYESATGDYDDDDDLQTLDGDDEGPDDDGGGDIDWGDLLGGTGVSKR